MLERATEADREGGRGGRPRRRAARPGAGATGEGTSPAALCACDPAAAFVPRSRAGVVDVAGVGRGGWGGGETGTGRPGASQDGLGGRPRSPPRTRDCGARGCARCSSPGLPDRRRASVRGTPAAANRGFPYPAPRGGLRAWGRPLLGRKQQELLLVRTARLLLSEQPCTIPPLVSRNFYGVGTVWIRGSGGRASWLAFFFFFFAVCFVPA